MEFDHGDCLTVSMWTPSLDGTHYILIDLHVGAEENPTHAPMLLGTGTPKRLKSPGPDRTVELRETHIVLSTGSGSKRAVFFFEWAVRPILKKLYGEAEVAKMKVHTTESETSILELTNDVFFPRANTGKPLRIVLFSGDGGIVDLVNGLSSKPRSDAYIAPQVVLLPLGTANALYHSINVATEENKWGVHTLGSTTAKPLPIFTATFSPGARLLVDQARSSQALPKDEHGNGVLHGAVVCSWAVHASIVADTDTPEYRSHGVDRFKMAATEALHPSDGSPPHTYRGRISYLQDGTWHEIEEKEHAYVLATMVSNLERPFCVSPRSSPLDGSMHLVHLGPMDGDEVMRIMGLAYQGGKHVEEEGVRYESIDGLRIEVLEGEERWRRVCVDGKIVRVEEGGWVEVRKEKSSVLDIVVA
ncbi:hypothetical protein BDW02DRAFT_574447 [Decorospora gaudefroyi]|uniref:DAGKc domain-containing protein n=1 Tax=Decorospora gaudefroyi TaxID=184978 RepID=A0A6A5JWG8_9PLEO|nr:hypothetical protein BDW02DRAFT_574447 [Decorospora gaudefroyi]